VNTYLREICERDFTAKDFRTWRGTSTTLKALIEQQMFQTKKECKQKMNKAIEEASKRLGNTIAICKKHYIHPDILKFFEKGELFDLIMTKSVVSFSERLSEEENLLLNIREQQDKDKMAA
jgi:DNA topoisomerase-1